MPRTLPFLIASLAALAALPAAASAAVTCSFDPVLHRLLITSTAKPDNPMIKREGSAIVVSAQGVPVDCGGPEPTVTTTDRIDFAASSAQANSVNISLAGGPFAPGFTGEGQFGTPEIEVVIDTKGVTDLLYVVGGDGDENIRAGTSEGVETRLNLNPADLIADADIVATGAEILSVAPGKGNDVVDARGGAGTVGPLQHTLVGVGDDGDDTFHAGASGSVMAGRAGDDTLVGGDGADAITGGPDDDVLAGGDHEDTLNFDQQPAGIEVDLSDPDPQATGQGTDTIEGFEDTNGTPGDDVIQGGAGANVLRGKGGDDLLEGDRGDDELHGEDGRDTASYRSSANAVAVDLSAPPPQATSFYTDDDTLEGIEDVVGTSHADVITGDGKDNRLDGYRDGDTVSGAGGADTLVEGKGPESEQDGVDVFDGGTGEDTIDYSSRTGPVAIRLDGSKNEGHDPNGDGVSSAAEEGDHAKNVENALTGTGADRLRAIGDVANELLGGGGDDRLDGGEGADVLDGGGGVDTLSYAGRAGAVAVRLDGLKNDGADPDGDGLSEAGEEADHAKGIENATGGDGPDRLRALGNAANALLGGPGDDRLDGGPGTDVLDGSTGTDTISYAGRAEGVAVRLDGIANDGADPNATGISSIEEEGDRDKAIENATGGDGPDKLFAFGSAVNLLIGGPGADHLDAKNATTTVDVLKCGTGADSHRSDASDTKDSCETATP